MKSRLRITAIVPLIRIIIALISHTQEELYVSRHCPDPGNGRRLLSPDRHRLDCRHGPGPSSLPVAGAEISLSQVETGLIRTTSTDVAGAFVFTGLEAGQYSLAIAMYMPEMHDA